MKVRLRYEVWLIVYQLTHCCSLSATHCHLSGYPHHFHSLSHPMAVHRKTHVYKQVLLDVYFQMQLFTFLHHQCASVNCCWYFVQLDNSSCVVLLNYYNRLPVQFCLSYDGDDFHLLHGCLLTRHLLQGCHVHIWLTGCHLAVLLIYAQ